MKFIKVCRTSSDEEVLLNLMHVESVRIVKQDEDSGPYVLILQTTAGHSYWSRDSFPTSEQAERWFTSELAEGPREVSLRDASVRIVTPPPPPTPEMVITNTPL